ncbi:MAG: SGNH/GDSL hydrolase family protein [Thermoanaerobaculia bacterium]
MTLDRPAGALGFAAWLLAATLLLAEVALRVAGLAYPSFYLSDPWRGKALRPGATGRVRGETTVALQINSDGLRDREHARAKPDDVFRVVVLGDSYAQASQVALQDAFWAVAERRLATCPAFGRRRVEFVNFGVAGYGTGQELLTLRHYAWSYEPDLVLLAFFVGNDVADNSSDLSFEQRPYFRVEGGRLVVDWSFRDRWSYRLRASPAGAALYRIVDRSRVAQAVNHILNRWRGRRLAEREGRLSRQGAAAAIEPGIDVAIYGPPVDATWTAAWQTTEELLREIQREVEGHGAAMLLVTLSIGVQVHPDRALREAFQRELYVPDTFYADRRLETFARDAGISSLILAPELQQYAVAHGVPLHGFATSRLGFGHWNERGHALAGERIARRICESPELQGERPVAGSSDP